MVSVDIADILTMTSYHRLSPAAKLRRLRTLAEASLVEYDLADPSFRHRFPLFQIRGT